MGFYVPETLRTLDNWVLWRLEDTGKGKPSKVPYSPITGRRAKTNDRRTWGSYDEAITRLKHDDFSGVGFVFTKSCGLVFIDLDDCFTPDGEETEFAKEIQSLFPATYMEISQSENGLHIVCKGSVKRDFRRSVPGELIEVYSSGHYMAFTGNAIQLVEPGEGQEGINILQERYTDIEQVTAPQQTATRALKRTEEEVIQIILASKQGPKFERLFTGSWTGYDSQSQADQAFINIVNHFTKSDESMILALWERSGLSKRRKGSRNDYIYRMIENARRTHTGSKATEKPQRFNVTDQPQKKRNSRFL